MTKARENPIVSCVLGGLLLVVGVAGALGGSGTATTEQEKNKGHRPVRSSSGNDAGMTNEEHADNRPGDGTIRPIADEVSGFPGTTALGLCESNSNHEADQADERKADWPCLMSRAARTEDPGLLRGSP